MAGTHELTRNEIEQIGFRVARELGHRTAYPVDADGEFPYQRVVDYGKASGRSTELEALMIRQHTSDLSYGSPSKEVLDRLPPEFQTGIRKGHIDHDEVTTSGRGPGLAGGVGPE